MPAENQQPLIDHVPDQSELAGVTEHELHHSSIEVPGSYVMSKQEALKEYGINGDIRAVITLPGDGSDEPPKQIAIIDFGDFEEEEPPFVISGEGMSKYSPLYGRAKGRFGVFGLNYNPKDHLSSYEVLEDGVTDFGSQDPNFVSRHSFMLGLTEVAAGNDMVAPNHFSVELHGRGIRVSDHSDKGTKVAVGADQSSSVSLDDQEDDKQTIGVNSDVKVLRSNGEIDYGWIITGIMIDESTGKTKATVVKPHPTDDKENVMSKTVDWDALQKLNS